MLKGYGWKPDGIWGTDPVFMVENGQYYYYHNDHLGTPQKMTDGSGTVVWSAEYAAFGAATVDPSSTVVSNLRFPGQYFDEETGLHYNYFRYYNPQTGRYAETDPIGLLGGINVYAYADSNAIGRLDVYGLKGLGSLDCEMAVKTKGKKGLLGFFLAPLINKIPPGATKGLVKVIVGIEDAKFGIFISSLGIATIPTAPTFWGAIGSTALITTGVSYTGVALANTGEGLNEFLSNGGISGVWNEISGYVAQQ